jgi:two-component system, NarL family, response regulator LiaR
METTPIRMILIDDHRQVHEAVALALAEVGDIEMVAQGSNGQDAIALCEEYRPDIVLLDVVMPVMGGLEAAKAIHQRFPDVKILVISSFQDDDSVRSMLTNGAVGYVLKGSLVLDLAETIRTIWRGKSVFSTEITQTLLNPSQTQHRTQRFSLTHRELEILKLMSNGKSNSEIAALLVISLATVKFHVSNILSKLNVNSRVEAVSIAVEQKLVE